MYGNNIGGGDSQEAADQSQFFDPYSQPRIKDNSVLFNQPYYQNNTGWGGNDLNDVTSLPNTTIMPNNDTTYVQSVGNGAVSQPKMAYQDSKF